MEDEHTEEGDDSSGIQLIGLKFRISETLIVQPPRPWNNWYHPSKEAFY